MIFLKTLGIILAAFVAVIALVLIARVHVVLRYDLNSDVKLYIRALGLKLGNKKTPKVTKKREEKPGKLMQRIKKLFGVDALEAEGLKSSTEATGISATLERLISVLAMLAGQLGWLVKRLRVHRFRLHAVCGGDAADAAIEYGVICATVYPIAGAVDASVKTKKNALDIRVGCNFDGEPDLVFETDISIRVIHLIRALMRTAHQNAQIQQEAQ